MNLVVSYASLRWLSIFVLAIPCFAFAESGRLCSKISNDGVACYRLLPVKMNDSHRVVVERRIQQQRSLVSLPVAHEIERSVLPPVRDQGEDRNSCVYFATVGLLEGYYFERDPSARKSLKISEECLIDLRNWEFFTSDYLGSDKPFTPPDPNGDLPQSLIQTIEMYGAPEEKNYGDLNCIYDTHAANGHKIAMDDYRSIFDKGLSLAYGKDISFDLNDHPTIESLKELIANDIPAVVIVFVYDKYKSETDWRYDPNADEYDGLLGGHAITLTGYSVVQGKTIFSFKNSWSDKWGNSGYGTIDDSSLFQSWSYSPQFDFALSLRRWGSLLHLI